MAYGWNTERVLITVRTYPVPAKKGIEVSCTAAVSEQGMWRRLFPVPYRSLPEERRFSKYQWIEVALKKASDPRPESYHLNIESIKLGAIVPTNNNWSARRALLQPLMRPSLCAIRKERDDKSHPTLGLFKPAKIRRLLVAKSDADWTPSQKSILGQLTLGFEQSPREELEKYRSIFITSLRAVTTIAGGTNYLALTGKWHRLTDAGAKNMGTDGKRSSGPNLKQR